MPDYVTTVVALLAITATLIVVAVLVIGGCVIMQNTQFYANWQRNRRERMAKKFMESLKK